MGAARDGSCFVRTTGGPQVVHRVDNDDRVGALPTPFEAGVHGLFASTQEVLALWALQSVSSARMR